MARASGHALSRDVTSEDIPMQSLDVRSRTAAVHPDENGLSPTVTGTDSSDDEDGADSSPYPLPRHLFAKRKNIPEHERIDNPFAFWEEDEAIKVAKRLAYEYKLHKSEAVFVRAARVLSAQRDADGKRVPDDTANDASTGSNESLSPEEQDVVRAEGELSFWEQPWPLKTTFLMLFVAAMVQGWTQTGTNGANLGWPQGLQLGDASGYGASSCGSNPDRVWVFAAVNAAPYLAAGVLCLFSDLFINELRFGRRGAIIVSSISVFLAAILGSATRRTWQFALSRVLLGFGMGCKASVVPVFAAEIAPPHLRGTLVMNWQVFDALGIFLGFSANLIASLAKEAAWRWQVGSTAVPALALFWGAMFVCWDSPRFLMKHEKRFQRQHEQRTTSEPSRLRRSRRWILRLILRLPLRIPSYQSDAYSTLLLLRGEPILAAKELLYAHCQLLVEKGSRKGTEFSTWMTSEDLSLEYGSGIGAWAARFKRLFAEGFIRRELLAAATVMISQQLCGINVLIFYSSTLFCQTADPNSGSSVEPLLLSWGLGLTNVVFTYPAYFWIESKGRRNLVLWTLPFLTLIMATVAVVLSKPIPSTQEQPPLEYTVSRRDSTIFLAYLFTAIYAFGLGPVPFTLSAEIFPLEERMVGMSVAVALNFIGAGLLTLLVPPLTDNAAMLLGPFAILNFAAYIFVWAFVREVAEQRTEVRRDSSSATSNGSRMEPLTLEEMYQIFKPSVAKHVMFQWRRLWGWQKPRNSVPESFLEWIRGAGQEEHHGNGSI